MPYITEGNRILLDRYIEDLGSHIVNVGELNYAVTRLSLQLLKNLGLKYTNISNVLGTLTAVKDELYRRIAVPYEDWKIETNGDVKEYEELGGSI